MANKVYQALESAITWLAAGGTAAFTPTSLAGTSGRQGAHHDLGTSSIARRFAWRAWIVPGATRTVGNTIEVYLKTSDGTHHDNDDGTGDLALSSVNKLNNLLHIGTIVIDEDAAVEMTKSGEVFLAHRYVAPVFYNTSANALSATAGHFGFSLTPVSDEIQ
jgi:hypothetical protein